MPILGTAASEFLSKEERNSYFGKVPAVGAIAFIAGSLSGGFISELENGFTLCFILMTLLSLVNLGEICSLIGS